MYVSVDVYVCLCQCVTFGVVIEGSLGGEGNVVHVKNVRELAWRGVREGFVGGG